MNKLYIHIFCYLLFSINSFGQNTIFNTRHLSVEDGLLGRRVNDIIQDNNGFIWIATNEGLNRFDGYQFQHFTKSSHGLSANNIYSMAKDDVGDIWITYHRDRFIVPYTQVIRPETGEILSIKEKLGTIYQEKFSKVRVLPNRGYKNITLNIIKDKKKYIYKEHKMIPFNYFYTLFDPLKKEIWVSNKNGNIYKVNLDGTVLDSLKIDIPHYKRAINFTRTGGLLTLVDIDTPRTKSILHKKATESKFKIVKTFSQKTYFKNLSHGFLNGDILYFEYENEVVNYDLSKISISSLRNLFFDNQNNLWLETDDGIVILTIKPQRFKQYLKNAVSHRPKPTYDGRGIWANEEILYAFSPSGSFRYHFENRKLQPLLTEALNKPKAHSVTQAKDSTFWIGTKNALLIQMDKATGKVISKVKGATSQIWSLLEDKNKRIWLGKSQLGLSYYEPDKMQEVQKYTLLNGFDEIEKAKIIQIVEDRRDNNYLWLACQSGWYRLHIKEGLKHRFWSEGKNGFNIPANEIHFTYQDKNGAFWLATSSSGLLKITLNSDYKVESLQQFTIKEGLSSNTIYAIYEDENNSLWMSTNNGINRIHKETGKVQVFLEEDGLPHYEFNRLSNFQRKDGEIFFGTLNGIVSFHPKNFTIKKEYNVPLKISTCEKYSDKVDKMLNITAEVLRENKIIIAPNERLVTLYVASQNYADAPKTKYTYRIKGLQERFVHANKNEITLSGLPYGKYILEVKAKAPDGRFSKQMISLPIIIQRPFYLQWWFVLLVLVSIVFLFWQIFLARTKTLQSRKKELEEIVKDRTFLLQQQASQLQLDKSIIEEQATKLRSLDKMKSRFFTNISHELRTPLTLILSPAQSIIRRKKSDNRDFTSAQLIEQNAQKLLKRINEILDLTKLEAHEIELKPQPTPFYKFTKRLIATFESLATQKNQELTLQYQLDKELSLLLDQDKYELVFNNFLSNAIKYSPNGSFIKVSFFEKKSTNEVGEVENRIVLSVSDNGYGISKKDISKVFDRFFKSQDNQNNSDNYWEASSGIGLALSKEVATLMKGEVYVNSELGKGSTFFFEISSIETVNSGKLTSSLSTPPIEDIQIFSQKKNEGEYIKSKKTILLVEDNIQLSSYIQLTLSEKYNVVTAQNGQEALEQLEEFFKKNPPVFLPTNAEQANASELPSLIVSDIMMPVMDGFELLKQLKSSNRFRHIPVVMLTARSSVKDKLQALRIGVDDYILKPFHEEELMTRIDNLVKNVANKTIQVATNSIKNKSTITPNISATDLKWLENVEKRFKKEISNSKFNIELLSTEMNISRSQLQRRIKKITGLSPNQYFRTIKLQAAREILENGKMQTVSEVAYAVGFDTPAYFTKVYEKHFGKKPIEYLK